MNQQLPSEPKPGSSFPQMPGDNQTNQETPRQWQTPTRKVVFRPIVTYSLMGVTILVYLLQMGSQFLFHDVDLAAGIGMKVNELIIQGQLWRLITPMLLHGSILHIGFNMYALNIFGPRLERYFGRSRFLALYLLSGFAGNVMSFLFTTAPSLGSSTAIFGLLAAEGVFLYQNRGIFGKNAQRALGNIILVAVVNLVIGMSPGIDNWGHVGGLLGGILFAWFGGPVLRAEGIFPTVTLVDERDKSDVIRNAVSVIALFSILALVTIILRGI